MALDIRNIIKDPEFYQLDPEVRKQVMSKVDPEFSKLPEPEQYRVIEKLSAQFGTKSQQTPQQPTNKMVPAHTTGIPDMDLAAAHTKMQMTADTVDPRLRAIAPYYRMGLEGGGAVAGSVAGSGVGPAGTIAGGGLGYAMGKKGADIVDEWAGIKKPQPLGEQLVESGKDIATGAAFEMGGQAAVPLLAKGAELAGKVVKPVLGKLSGVGPGAIEESLKGTDAFKKALRGDITGEEVVNHARDALNVLKDQRSSAYQGQLEEIAKNSSDIDISPLIRKTSDLMKKYNVNVNPDGTLDTSRIAMGQAGRKDIETVLETVMSWGKKPGDSTAKGLDVLKRQLDDFYSDSSQARAFVTSLRNSVKDTIIKEVPEYGVMTKGYSEATQLIKDVEADLMLRKQGMSGRTTADKTLRRLMSSMRDNFEMRKELVEVLGNKGSQDLAGEIAGYTMNTFAPRGLSGTGPALVGQAAFAVFNPKFWPVLAASSPRVQGEFLRVYGKAYSAVSKIPERAVSEGVRQGMIAADNND
jgi:ribosomal protein S17E